MINHLMFTAAGNPKTENPLKTFCLFMTRLYNRVYYGKYLCYQEIRIDNNSTNSLTRSHNNYLEKMKQ